MRQKLHIKEFQIIYVAIPPFRRWNLTLHPLGIGTVTLFQRIQYEVGAGVALEVRILQWRSLTNKVRS